ncbi:unnamed protein product [Brugia pahangi]|uniref:Ovule protein n=1 Tax=Brugia pahangi TaxID=6280 RepID=A0A0N4TDG2_BRUPA|nr:unnamed protein product [Brugia pahangi]
MSLPEGPLSIPDLHYRSRSSPAHYSSTTIPLSYPCCDMVCSFHLTAQKLGKYNFNMQFSLVFQFVIYS